MVRVDLKYIDIKTHTTKQSKQSSPSQSRIFIIKEKCEGIQRILTLAKMLFATLITVGLILLDSKARAEWEAVFTGKIVRTISISEECYRKILVASEAILTINNLPDNDKIPLPNTDKINTTVILEKTLENFQNTRNDKSRTLLEKHNEESILKVLDLSISSIGATVGFDTDLTDAMTAVIMKMFIQALEKDSDFKHDASYLSYAQIKRDAEVLKDAINRNKLDQTTLMTFSMDHNNIRFEEDCMRRSETAFTIRTIIASAYLALSNQFGAIGLFNKTLHVSLNPINMQLRDDINYYYANLWNKRKVIEFAQKKVVANTVLKRF